MRLLVAVDGSEQALEAARHALRLREAGLKAEIVLATVQEPTFLYEMALPPTSNVLKRVSSGVGHRALEGAEALLREAGAPFEIEIGSGEVAPTLLSIAQALGCDGIVFGAGAGGGSTRIAGLRVAGSSPRRHHARDSGQADRRW
jgi:nucleotide-binding universal stress UspA family protein